jgi:VanZ family protein
MNIKILAPVTWMAVITYLSTLPGRSMPQINIVSIDKIGHFGVYGVFMALFVWAFYPQKSDNHRFMISILLFVIGWGIFMEWVQATFFPDRFFEVADMLANTLGALCGLWAARWWFRVR